MKNVFNHSSGRMPGRPPGQESGIALVITLIMLAVTLVMALAFLAISTRERGSVSTSTDATHAREATEAALAHAEAQILANLLANTNSYNFELLVSTNYLTPDGFATASGGPGTGISSPTNVNYTYADGTPLISADMQVNVANLQYLPRPPVFVPTNGANGASGYDFRYYLDLNRNHQFDPNNGVSNWVYISSLNAFTNTGPVTEVGDPEWIGVLEHPDQPHGPQNKFIARYAFIAVPVGNTLDVNAIYNDAGYLNGGAPLSAGNDCFLRNEDVGNWEMNLAAFFADLNTNEWDTPARPYAYQAPLGFVNNGAAFDDALSILRYRYDTNLFNLLSVQQSYGGALSTAATVFKNNGLDNYSIGPLQTNANLPFHSDNSTITARPWSGSGSTNLFFSLADFFNQSIFRPAGFGILANSMVLPDRLVNAGSTNPIPGNPTIPTYDRYTFYRMLEELGTDSTPDYGKMNLNYVNVDANGNVVPGMETNFIAWNASQFFTNAADRLLRTYTSNWFNGNFLYFTNTFGNYTLASGAITNTLPFGVTNIPVWVGGRFVYTSAVQRLLQLAANLYDATTTNLFPSVFRPTFGRDVTTGNIYISGYTQVSVINGGISDFRLSQPVDISLLVAGGPYPAGNGGFPQDLNNINVYGVPWIIGAKKGLPSFNQMTVLNEAQVSRLVQVNRFSTNNYLPANYTTNVMFVMSISNSVGMSLWNSYNADYVSLSSPPAPISIFMYDQMRVNLTNAFYSGSILTNFSYYVPNLADWPSSAWTYSNATLQASQYSFYFTNWTFPFLPPSVYQPATGQFIPLSDPAAHFNTNDTVNHPFPQFGMMTTNWAQAFIIDGSNVVDYVQFSGPNRTRNLTAELADPNYPDGTGTHYMWSTNAYVTGNAALGEPPYGEVNQILLSKGSAGVTAPPGGNWATTPTAPGAGTSPAAQQAFFGGFFTPSWTFGDIKYVNTQYSVQAPYTPTRTMYDYSLWEANDPLVHYLASDLYYAGTNANGLQKTDTYPPALNTVGTALNQVGGRFQPWGQGQQLAGFSSVDTNIYNLSYRDPLVAGPDGWQFPTNLFPDVGWLGRVHRGTPWQTVYLKSPDILKQTNTFDGQNNGTNTWLIWTGNVGNWFDANNASPVTDRLLFDLFTTEPNENATLGQLSINQPHLAAWSAVFSGMVVLTNYAGTNTPVFFPPAGPAGTNSYLGYIWNSIQQTRTDTNQFRQQVFNHVGDILATPALTVQSPFLIGDSPNVRPPGVSDVMYEWLPQHIMSHLNVGTPRYVIYCYGQALKPAPGGIVTSGVNALMCTNYQVVSESAVRAVVQVENPNSFTPHVVLKNLNPLPPDQ